MAGDIANAATRSVLDGSSFGDNLLAALPDVITQTLGNLVTGDFVSKTVIPKSAALAMAFANQDGGDGSTSIQNIGYNIPSRSDLEKQYGKTLADTMIKHFLEGTGVIEQNGKFVLDPKFQAYLTSRQMKPGDVAAESTRLMKLADTGQLRVFYEFDYAVPAGSKQTHYDVAMTNIGDDSRATMLALQNQGLLVREPKTIGAQIGNAVVTEMMRRHVFEGAPMTYPKGKEKAFGAAESDLRDFIKYREQFVTALAKASLATGAIEDFAKADPVKYAELGRSAGDMRDEISNGYFTLRPFYTKKGPDVIYAMQFNQDTKDTTGTIFTKRSTSEIIVYRPAFNSRPNLFAEAVFHELMHGATWNDRVYAETMDKLAPLKDKNTNKPLLDLNGKQVLRSGGPSTAYHPDAKTYYDAQYATGTFTNAPAAFVKPGTKAPPGTQAAVDADNVLFENGAMNWYSKNVLQALGLYY
jgi:hypothetical protein